MTIRETPPSKSSLSRQARLLLRPAASATGRAPLSPSPRWQPKGMSYAKSRSPGTWSERIVAVARASRRTFGVVYYRRAYPKVHRAMELTPVGTGGRATAGGEYVLRRFFLWFDSNRRRHVRVRRGD